MSQKRLLFAFVCFVFATGILFSFQNCSEGFKVQSSTVESLSPLGSEVLPLDKKSCDFSGVTVLDGDSVDAYQTETTLPAQACVSEKRKCSDGVLSGSLTFKTCTPNKIRKFVQGANAACVVVNDSLKCWGANKFVLQIAGSTYPSQGALFTDAYTIIPSGVQDFSHVWYYTACAVVSGAVRCWGYEDNSANQSVAYDRIVEPTNAKQVFAFDQSCVLLESGDIKCYKVVGGVKPNDTLTNWPISQLTYNFGPLYCGLLNDSVKCKVAGQDQTIIASGASSLSSNFDSASATFNCAIVGTALKCFGNFIPLPDGTVVSSPLVAIDVLTDVTQVSTALSEDINSPSHSRSSICVVRSSGAAECWGYTQTFGADPIIKPAKITIMAEGAVGVYVGHQFISVLLKDGSVMSTIPGKQVLTKVDFKN